jgi:hypothetical protein
MENEVEIVDISPTQLELIPGDTEKLALASRWGAEHKIIPLPKFNLLIILAENLIVYRKADGKYEVLEIPHSDFGVTKSTTVRIMEATVIEGTSTLVLRIGIGFRKDRDGHTWPLRVQMAAFDLKTFELSQINELDIYHDVQAIKGSHAFVRNEANTLSVVDMRTWAETQLPGYGHDLELIPHAKKIIGNRFVPGIPNTKEVYIFNFNGNLESRHNVSIDRMSWSYVIPSPNATGIFIMSCGLHGFWKVGSDSESYAEHNGYTLFWNLG